MFEWEVVIEKGRQNADRIKQLLDRMSTDGWDFVQAYTDTFGDVTFIFKRAKAG